MANLRKQADMGDAIPSVKVCTKCGTEKPLEEFHRDKRGKAGRCAQCKVCTCARARGWYESQAGDPEFKARRKEQGARALKRWRAANAESIKVYMDAYRKANKEAIAEQGKRWRTANAQRVTEKNQRRRARLLEAFVADVDREQIWARDEGVCQLCNIAIDRSLAWPHPLSMTIDHIIPLSLGGSHEPSNVQLAHAVCNSRKCDRVDEVVAAEA